MESLIIILKNFALAFFGVVLFAIFYTIGLKLGANDDSFVRNSGFLTWGLYISFKMSQELYYRRK